MAIVSNSHSIISFSDSGFGQLLTTCDVKSPIFGISYIRDQVPENDQNKGMANLSDRIKDVVEVLDNKNNNNKALENLIDNKHLPINVAATLKTSVIDKTTIIFIE